MANLNNPAGRLLYWLELGQQRNMGSSAMGEWCAVFGLDADQVGDRGECARRGSMLIRLAQDVRREAQQLPPQYHPDMLQEHFGEVETMLDQFTILPSIAMQGMFAQINGTGWQSLKYLDAMLSTHRPEIVVEHADIKDHIAKVRELIDEILADDDLDDALKRYVVARLRDIEDALTDALITGAGGVELAVNATIGAAQMDHDWWDRIAHTRWAPRIAGVWMAIVTTLGAVGGVPALMPGHDAPPVIEQTVQVDTSVTVNADGEDIHDAEIVEDGEAGPRKDNP